MDSRLATEKLPLTPAPPALAVAREATDVSAIAIIHQHVPWTGFPLFDLPAELRELIFEYSALAAFEVPALAVYTKPSNIPEIEVTDPEDLDEIEHYDHNEHWRDLCLAHDERRGLHGRNKLAVLYTCRQVYSEAAKFYYTKMSLDLRMIREEESYDYATELVNVMKYKLQFVRHIEMEDAAAYKFLQQSASANPETFWSAIRSTKCFMPEFSCCIKQTMQLRTYLFSIRSVTVHIQPNDRCRALGVSMIARLGVPSNRKAMQRMFPYLADIRCVNEHGSERFSRRKDGCWELWYSKERIPMIAPQRDWVWGVDQDQLYDLTTSLTVSTAMSSLWPELYNAEA